MVDKRAKVVDEIFDTEAFYVNSLELCYTYFHDGFLKAKSPVFGKGDVDFIFEHYQEVLNVNQRLLQMLKALKQTNQLAVGIGKTFATITPFFKIYCLYISHVEKVNQELSRLEQDPRYFALHDEIQESLPTQPKLDLRSFLIMPVQRLPRYNLLLSQLLSTTPPDHPDYTNLEAALAQIKVVTMDVNEKIKLIEKKTKVLIIKNRLTGLKDFPLITPDRSYVMEGAVLKVCKKSNKPRYLYLFNDLFICGSGTQKVAVEHCVTLANVTMEPPDERWKNAFSLRLGVTAVTFLCETEADWKRWTEGLEENIALQRKNIPSADSPGVPPCGTASCRRRCASSRCRNPACPAR